MRGRCIGCGIVNLPAALNAPEVYVGAVRQRFGRPHGPALVCPDRSTGPDFLPGATLLTFSQRTSEKSCPFCPCATRANCLSCSQRTSKTFCPRFSWATFQRGQSVDFFMCEKVGERRKVCPFAHAQHGQICPRLPMVAHGLPIFHGQLFSSTLSGG